MGQKRKASSSFASNSVAYLSGRAVGHAARAIEGYFKKGKHAHTQTQKFGHKHAHTQTHTKTKTTEEKLKGDDVHSGVTDWTCKILAHCHQPVGVDFKSGCHQLSETSSARWVGSAGQTYVGLLSVMASASQQLVNSGSSSNLIANPALGTIAYLDLNPNRSNTGSVQFVSQLKHSTEKIWVASHNVKVSLFNPSSIAQSVWIYVVKSKEMSPNDVTTNYQKILEGEGRFFNANSVAGIAAGQSTGGSVGYFGSTNLDQFSPSCNKEFKRMYEILKCHRVNLAASAQEDLDFRIKHDYMVDALKLISQSNNLSNDPNSWTQANCLNILYPKHCIQVFAVVRGGAIIDETAAGAKVPTFASPNVGWIISKKTKVYPVRDNGQRYNTREGVFQLPVNVAGADQKAINVVDALAAVVSA